MDSGAEIRHGDLRHVAWSEAFPFVRLFRTLRLALDFKRLVLALAALLLVYFGGCILDGLWGETVAVRGIPDGGLQNEIQAYATLPHHEFVAWQRQAEVERHEVALAALQAADFNEPRAELDQRLQQKSVRDWVLDKPHRGRLTELRKMVRTRAKAGLQALQKDPNLPGELREERMEALEIGADRLILALTDKRLGVPPQPGNWGDAIRVVTEAGAAEERAADATALRTALTRQDALHAYEQLRPSGPFRTLLTYEMQCFAAAVRGVATGRLGFGAGAFSAQPALGGSLVSAFRGLWWAVVYHLGFLLLLAAWCLAVFALFGGALCRSVAVQAARDETITLGESLRFARQKWTSFVLAPIVPILIALFVMLLLYVGGLFGAIPYFEVITGVLYPLGLLGGFVLTLAVLLLVLGFHLMWPTIAVEGSDGFDALSRAANYIAERIWKLLFYILVLLVFGALSFILIRLIAVLTLKFSHSFTKFSMNIDAASEMVGWGKLDAIWTMPAWADLALIPSALSVPFWGTFYNAPLDWSEGIALFLFRLWVFTVVGLVGAFVVSFFFCGSTQMYYLLRRDVDATDYEEVYYEEPETADVGGSSPIAATTSTTPPEDVVPPSATPPPQPS